MNILDRFSVFDMLMVILLYFSLKVADVSLSESGHLVPWRLTPHRHLLGAFLFVIPGLISSYQQVQNRIFVKTGEANGKTIQNPLIRVFAPFSGGK